MKSNFPLVRKLTTLMLMISSLLALGSTARVRADEGSAISRGQGFLAALLDKEMNLLPEYAGANVYWLYHDNYLAAKVLAKSHPEVAQKITDAIKQHGERDSGKIEILFGEAPRALPFRNYQLIELKQVGQKIIRTERTTQQPMRGWQAYADLRFFAAIALATSNTAEAKANFAAGMKMFDGIGFDDPARKKLRIYSTYKLALAILAAERLDQTVPRKIVARLRGMQNKSGGWITDYQADGKPVGKANVETTSLAILALQSLESPK